MALPFFPIEFTKRGERFAAAEEDALLAAAGGITDLLVASHGWNNDEQEAKALYDELFSNLSRIMDQAPEPGMTAAALCVYWPSKKFAEEDLIPGGGAAAVGAADVNAILHTQITRLEDFLDPEDDRRTAVGRLKNLISTLDASPEQQEVFVRVARTLLPPDANEEEAVIPHDFQTVSGNELLSRLGRPVAPAFRPRQGGAATLGASPPAQPPVPRVEAAGLRDIGQGIKEGARRLLNLVTYYQMKSRAGLVGEKGLAPLLGRIRQRFPKIRLHLVGHSFGGRLVTAAAAASPTPVESLCLLQAAFSHYGFAQAFAAGRDGLYRTAITREKIRGPVLVTFSENDKAVGLAYPIASRIANQIGAAVGDKNDPYGGIGRNGAQKTPEADETAMVASGTPYALDPAKKIHNLKGDTFIHDHSDVRSPAVAWILRQAMRG